MEPTIKNLPPKNYLGWAIFTLLICWPFGIPAIVNATKVDKYWLAGYQDEAIRAAKKARKWVLLLPRIYLVLILVMLLVGLVEAIIGLL
jgi:hypothetical protein